LGGHETTKKTILYYIQHRGFQVKCKKRGGGTGRSASFASFTGCRRMGSLNFFNSSKGVGRIKIDQGGGQSGIVAHRALACGGGKKEKEVYWWIHAKA